jgi:hypothetical protein
MSTVVKREVKGHQQDKDQRQCKELLPPVLAVTLSHKDLQITDLEQEVDR